MRKLPECSVSGCASGADPRWFVYTSDGQCLPACDGHGGLTVQDCNLREPRPTYDDPCGDAAIADNSTLTASIAALTADLRKAEGRIAEAKAEAERMRWVLDAARAWLKSRDHIRVDLWTGRECDLLRAIVEYDAAKPEAGKDSK